MNNAIVTNILQTVQYACNDLLQTLDIEALNYNLTYLKFYVRCVTECYMQDTLTLAQAKRLAAINHKISKLFEEKFTNLVIYDIINDDASYNLTISVHDRSIAKNLDIVAITNFLDTIQRMINNIQNGNVILQEFSNCSNVINVFYHMYNFTLLPVPRLLLNNMVKDYFSLLFNECLNKISYVKKPNLQYSDIS